MHWKLCTENNSTYSFSLKASEILLQINNTSGHKTALLTYKEDIVEKIESQQPIIKIQVNFLGKTFYQLKTNFIQKCKETSQSIFGSHKKNQ